MTACSAQPTEQTIDNERSQRFAEFQTFADRNFPGWTVNAIRADESSFGNDSTIREHYYVVMSKDGQEKVVFLVKAQFINKNGETISQIYKPVFLPPDHPEAMQDDR